MLRGVFLFQLFNLLTISISAQVLVNSDSIPRLHKNLVALNPFYTIVGLLNIGYEYSCSREFGIGMHAYYDLANREEVWERNYRLFMVDQQIRYYPFQKSPKGLHIGTSLMFGHCSFEVGYDTTYSDEWVSFDIYVPGKIISFSPGVMAGYRFMIKRRVGIDGHFRFGPNYVWSYDAENFSIFLEGKYSPWIGIDIGWNFK